MAGFSVLFARVLSFGGDEAGTRAKGTPALYKIFDQGPGWTSSSGDQEHSPVKAGVCFFCGAVNKTSWFHIRIKHGSGIPGGPLLGKNLGKNVRNLSIQGIQNPKEKHRRQKCDQVPRSCAQAREPIPRVYPFICGRSLGGGVNGQYRGAHFWHTVQRMRDR